MDASESPLSSASSSIWPPPVPSYLAHSSVMPFLPPTTLLCLYMTSLFFFKILLKPLICGASLTTVSPPLTFLLFSPASEARTVPSSCSSMAPAKQRSRRVGTVHEALCSSGDYKQLQDGASDFPISAFSVPGAGPGTWLTLGVRGVLQILKNQTANT